MEIIETILLPITHLYDALYKVIGYQGVAVVSAVFFGLAIASTIMFLVKMKIPAPDRQIMITWEYISSDARSKKSKHKKNLDAEHLREYRMLDKKKFIETSYRRLGRTLTFEDYKKSVASYQISSILLGAVLTVVGIAIDMMIFIILGLLVACIGLLFGDALKYGSINGSIKKLNYKQKIELPVLISRYVAIAESWKQYPLKDVLYTYLPYAGALKCDIELTLADIKSFGDMMALDLWQARATHRHTTDMMEITQLVEKLKKLYTKGDEIYVRNELTMLQRTIDEKYVATWLEKTGRKRSLILIGLMLGSFAMAGSFFIVPKIVEVIQATAEAF